MNIILANGSYPSDTRPLQLLAEAEHVVCCDGAALSFIEHGGKPDVIIGDLDSLSENLRIAYAERIVQVSEQETNDLSKAFHYCLQRGWRDITILGATGKREDHTIGNISLLVDFAAIMPEIRMVTDDGDFFVATHSGSFSSIPGQEISLFAFSPDTPITSGGLKYPLKRLVPRRLWEATLNVALADEFSLEFPEGRSVLVYRAYL